MLHRLGALYWVGESRQTRCNPSIFPQKSVNGAGGFWQTHPPLFQGLIPTEIVEDRPGTGGATQTLGGIIPDLQHPIHHLLVESSLGMMRGDESQLDRLIPK